MEIIGKMQPPRYKHFARGNKLTNSLLTKIRVGRSDLNQHKFTIGLVESPMCDCHYGPSCICNFPYFTYFLLYLDYISTL